MLIGFGCIFYGVMNALQSYTRVYGVGLLLLGVGSTLLGITDGFSDPTPKGRLLFRIAVIAFLIGTPIVVSDLYNDAFPSDPLRMK
jgi:hypothetical protein